MTDTNNTMTDISQMTDEEVLNMSEEELSKYSSEETAEEVSEEQDTLSDNDSDDSSPEEVEEEEVLAKDKDSVDTEESEDTTSDEKDNADINYEDIYKQIFKPFKANGKEISVKTPQEVISLMQMGANYSKKMQALKPSLTAIKMLEKHNLMSTEKLAYLIDLSNKNPDAIGKLIKDSGLDTFDIDITDENTYKPDVSKYAISETELALQEQLSSIEHTPTFHKTVELLADNTKGWDKASTDYIVKQSPALIGVINSHMESGIFDIISTEIERQRMFGQLQGEPDLEAYRKVGDMLNEQGAFDHLAAPVQAQQSTTGTQPVQSGSLGVRRSTTPSQADTELRNKRKAVAPSKQTIGSTQADLPDPSSMSDEEFIKFFEKNYM